MAATVVDATDGVDVPLIENGLTPFQVTVSVATTSLDEVGDCVLCFLFPAGAYLPTFPGAVKVYFATELDSNASPTLDLNWGIGDSDGVLDTTFVTDSAEQNANAQAEDLFNVDHDLDGFLDVGGKYLIMRVGTAAAATAAAGTVSVCGVYAAGLVPLTSS
jgi:hypothetical protein